MTQTSAEAIANAHAWFEVNSGWAPPDDDVLAEWVADGVCRCPDDCIVAPDAWCEHGLASWWLILRTLWEADLHHVDVDGVRIAFRRAGTGPPLLLLHGAVCDSRTWRTELATLSDQFTVIAWDAPGCGGSSDPPESWRMRNFAACLVGFIDAIDVWKPHVLGHSWGSALALELSRQHPAVPRSLVLAGAYAGWAGSLPADEVAKRLRFALDTADRLPGGFDPATMPGLFSDAMPADRAHELATIMAESRPTGTRVMAHALAEADLRDTLPKIRIPTLLLYGDADERSPLPVAKSLHDQIDSSTLVVMPGLGHESYLESAETFDAEVRTFLHAADPEGRT